MASHDPFSMHRTMSGRGPQEPVPGTRGPGGPGSGVRRPAGARSAAAKSGGADGNERLTALTGAVLLVLLAAEGFTILAVRQLITAHFFIGMLLIGPVALKLASTVYRFARYYTGSAPYRRKGPPVPLLRLLGPVVVAATVGVFGSGVGLAISGPDNSALWLFLHKGSFVVWFGAMSIHVLYYFWRVPGLIAADFRRRRAAGPAGNPGHGHGGPGYGGSPYGDRQGYGDRGYGDRQGYGDRGYGDRQGYGDRGYGGADRDERGYGGGPAYGRAVEILGGRGLRYTLLAASLLAGLVLAALTVHLAGAWHFGSFGH